MRSQRFESLLEIANWQWLQYFRSSWKPTPAAGRNRNCEGTWIVGSLPVALCSGSTCRTQCPSQSSPHPRWHLAPQPRPQIPAAIVVEKKFRESRDNQLTTNADNICAKASGYSLCQLQLHRSRLPATTKHARSLAWRRSRDSSNRRCHLGTSRFEPKWLHKRMNEWMNEWMDDCASLVQACVSLVQVCVFVFPSRPTHNSYVGGRVTNSEQQVLSI